MKPERSGHPLVDLFIRGVGRLMPADYASAVTADQYQLLKRRNRLLDGISQALCIGGFIGGVLLPLAVRGRPLQLTGWDVGVQFGLAVALPTLFILLATALQGGQRLREFLVFYSLKYGVDARKLFWFFYTPIILLGLVCVYFSYFRPVPDNANPVCQVALRPMTPARMNPTQQRRRAVAGSPKKMMPQMTVPAAPIPVHTV